MRGISQSRKHMTWYAKGFAGASMLRDRLCRIESLQDGMDCLDGAIAQIRNQQNVSVLSLEDMAEMIVVQQ